MSDKQPISPQLYSDIAPVENDNSSSTSPPTDAPDAVVDDHSGPEAPLEEEHAEPTRLVKTSPIAPSKTVRDSHEAMGCAVYRSWCSACVKGRGRNGPHYRKEREDGQDVSHDG